MNDSVAEAIKEEIEALKNTRQALVDSMIDEREVLLGAVK